MSGSGQGGNTASVCFDKKVSFCKRRVTECNCKEMFFRKEHKQNGHHWLVLNSNSVFLNHCSSVLYLFIL